MNPIVLSIPIFFLLIGLEVFYDRFYKKGVYRLNDALTNISCGITEQLSGVFAAVLTVGLYHLVYENYRLMTFPMTWYNGLLLFVLVDFFYYWAHRWSHEVNLFWAGHVVHHQSEEYNLSVALRQGAFQKLFTSLVYLPMALLGFATDWFLVILAYNTLYQFWIHTQLIGKMGWLEYVLNTPSHHRVHHGRDPKYIDKNHAATLIIWDKLFGTFQAEEEAPVYGITSPSQSWNPVYLQVKHFGDIWTDLKRVEGPLDKLKVLFYKPGWLPEKLGGYRAPQRVDAATYVKFDVSVSFRLNVYVLSQYLLLLGFTSYFLFGLAQFDWPQRSVAVFLIFIGVAALGELLAAKKWANGFEYLRLLVSAVLLIYLFPLSATWVLAPVGAVASMLFFYFIQKKR